MNCPIDILILSNGPGELSTWVQPVVKELRRQLTIARALLRISIILSPCANASGQEVAIAQRFPEVDRVQGAEHFFPFLLFGKTHANWDWRSRGVVLFLGGDQFFPIVIAKRLGYRTVIYAEWEARWHAWGDRFGVMNAEILNRVAPRYAHKFSVVGDLMAEAGVESGRVEEWRSGGGEEDGGGKGDGGAGEMMRGWDDESDVFTPPSPHHPVPPSSPLIGLLPGSKPMKLILGVPLTLAIAEHIYMARSDVQFVIPVAPTLTVKDLAAYADPTQNPIIQRLGWVGGELVLPAEQLPFLKTPAGVKVSLWTGFPAYDLLSRCCLCLTTIGANTAELGALGVPMIVLLPTQQLDIMRAWDGIPGLLVNLPGIGALLARGINWLALRRRGLLAWPNIWAKREIVPELVGALQPAEVAKRAIAYLAHPEQLQTISNELRAVRGQPGAAQKLVQLVCEELEIMN
ncbi:glycosyltransferase family protein [Leptodesmis sichuanensis]|uniref:lipid-A-disaccharide synthase n=1 Tax=Leptodesmis sichuanensis TaxID=2906798 RepID=UPI001F4846BE|nr:lipid-A-disaccharide synthase [Leptodesmis sichuanensis]UIE39713.1 lipid-A-disaccharide synthase [Leptodesmis sichuanensis A121]